MKKARMLVFLSVFMLLVSVVGLALSDTCALTIHELPEQGLSVPLPSEFLVFRRDLPTDDPIFAAFGLDADTVFAYMEQQDLYLDALAYDNSREVFVTVSEGDDLSFIDMTDEWLTALADFMTAQYVPLGITVTRHEIYRTESAAFILMWENTATLDGVQCFTTRNGSAISITFNTFSSMTDEELAMMYTILDGVTFN